MSGINWTSFIVRIPVNASAEQLYRCWSTRAGMESWFLRLSEYKQPNGALLANDEQVQTGDSYTWLWHGWDDDTVERGEILHCNGKDELKFSFGKAGICTVSIKEEKNTTLVELLQENIPDDEQGKQYWHTGCKTGWTFYLANLKSIAEGGLDLRNRDAHLRNVINS
ncbi:MAG: SRPBCC family protein [Lacibacter sp.]